MGGPGTTTVVVLLGAIPSFNSASTAQYTLCVVVVPGMTGFEKKRSMVGERSATS